MANLKDRDSLHPRDRETLFPCPACGMRGNRLIEYDDGTFWLEKCPWCKGLGATDSRTLAKFDRWRSILRFHTVVPRKRNRQV